MKKRVIIITGIMLVVAVVISGASLYYFFTRGLSYEGDLAAAVSSPVEIIRDEQGVPLIKAKTIEDAYFALGYVHTQDRYSIMKYYRAIAYGRISLLVGERGQVLDRLSHAIGFYRKAKEIRESLPEPYLGYLKSYAAGVNTARQQTLGQSLLKRPWNETDIIAMFILKEWGNAFLNNRELYFPLPNASRTKEIDALFPRGMATYYEKKDADSIQIIERINDLVKTYIGSFNRGMSFTVPAKNSQGDEYVMGVTCDSDMGVYPGWYPVTVEIGEDRIRGITHAGMPFFFMGANASMSFCGFNLNIDTQDFVIEQVRKLKDVVQYLGRGMWKNYGVIEIPVSASEQRGDMSVIFTTDNGPVLNEIFIDRAYKSDVVTLRSFFPGADYLKSLFTVPFARTIDQAALAVQNIKSLPRVYMFSSNEGAITMFSGKVPVRAAGESVFRSGALFDWNGLYDLSGARSRTLSEVVVGSADGEGVPFHLKEHMTEDRSRTDRIRELLGESQKMNIKNIESVLYDNRSVYAEKFVPLFIEILKDNPVTSSKLARIYFHDWDYGMDADKVAPTLYESILQNYLYETCADEIPERIDTIMGKYNLLIPAFYELVSKDSSVIFDDVRTFNINEGSERIFDRAFFKSLRLLGRKAGPLMDKWKWGDIHKGHYIIPFKKDSIFERMMYRITDTSFGGGSSTVLYGATGTDLAPTRVTSVTGIFNSGISRIGMNFTYSTNPLSPFYYGKMQDKLSFDLTYLNRSHNYLLRPEK